MNVEVNKLLLSSDKRFAFYNFARKLERENAWKTQEKTLDNQEDIANQLLSWIFISNFHSSLDVSISFFSHSHSDVENYDKRPENRKNIFLLSRYHRTIKLCDKARDRKWKNLKKLSTWDGIKFVASYSLRGCLLMMLQGWCERENQIGTRNWRIYKLVKGKSKIQKHYIICDDPQLRSKQISFK